MPPVDSKSVFNALGFVGLVGGTEVVSVMTMIPLYRGRRWLGWHNNPGCLGIARHLGNFASSFRPRLYGNQSPTALPAFDKTGPRFISGFSGKETESGHLGYLILERSKEIEEKIIQEMVGENPTTTLAVALLDVQAVNLDKPISPVNVVHPIFAVIPMATSIASCTMCALLSDWYMAFVILFGIFTSGLASMVIGSGRLTLQSPGRSPSAAVPGRGILVSGDTIVVLRGNEFAIDVIKRGKFNLEGSRYWKAAIHVCSLLFLGEFLIQLILVPQGTTYGQIMFIISLCVSGACSQRFSSTQREKLQTALLFDKLGAPEMRKFNVGTRATMTVFASLLLFHDVHHMASSNEFTRILNTLLPNTTPVWRAWKGKVVKQMHDMNDISLLHLKAEGEDLGLSEPDLKFLQAILGDAAAAFRGYFQLCSGLPKKD